MREKFTHPKNGEAKSSRPKIRFLKEKPPKNPEKISCRLWGGGGGVFPDSVSTMGEVVPGFVVDYEGGGGVSS